MMNKDQFRYRSSITGKFITQKFAEKHPKTTEKERIKNPNKKK